MIDFVNTSDIEAATDEIATPADLQVWLTGRGLLDGAAAAPSAREHAEALALREALRAVASAHNGDGEGGDAEALMALQQTAERGQLSVRFWPDGTVGTEAHAAGAPGALARLLVPVVQASADGSWARVKACRADDCRWAFYDASRNRSGRWCDMAVCGNRTKVRHYRSRSAER